MDETEDMKTTVLTNLPIVSEEAYPEHILPDDLGVYDNSDGNLTINTVQQVVEVAEPEPGEIIADEYNGTTQEQQQQEKEIKNEDPETEQATVYIMQIGEPAGEDMIVGEFEEYELCADEEAREQGEDNEEEEDEEPEEEDSLIDDPTYGEEDRSEEEQERFDCETCKRSFKTPAVSICL